MQHLQVPSEMVQQQQATCFSIEAEEAAETRMQRLISEHPVIIFSRSSCCMCHVMKKLLSNIGVNPTVIQIDDDQELAALVTLAPHHTSTVTVSTSSSPSDHLTVPAVFIGGNRVGGLESLVALHLSGQLVPMLIHAAAAL